MTGWICPKCGQCYSPFVDRCYDCCKPTWTITSTNPWVQPCNVTDDSYHCLICKKTHDPKVPCEL